MALAVAGGLAATAFVVSATCLHSNRTKIHSPTICRIPAYVNISEPKRALGRRGFCRVLDAWEHAYYLQYENRKTEFFEAVWSVWNWSDVSDPFEAARKVTIALPGAQR